MSCLLIYSKFRYTMYQIWTRVASVVGTTIILLTFSNLNLAEETASSTGDFQMLNNGPDELQPHSVKLEAQAGHSLTLSWEPPEAVRILTSSPAPTLIGFSVHYYSKSEPEKNITIPVDVTSQLIKNLQPSTNYTVYVTAHYTGNQTASSPKFVVSTLENPSTLIYKDCSCFEPGTKICNRLPSGAACLCKVGYSGSACDTCIEGFYLVGDKCEPCPCSPESSIGSCQLTGAESPDEVTCSCKPGYFKPLCDECQFNFYPVEDWCVPCHCLRCQDNNPECNHCPSYSHNFTDTQAVIRNCRIPARPQPRIITQSDGTVAVIAVVISLAFIASVAGVITCYRRRMQSRNQPPFWSIELAEDKVSLNASNDYQRLDGPSKSDSCRGHQRTPSVAAAAAAQRAADLPQYNCISI